MATSAIIMLILGLLSVAATATGIGVNMQQTQKTNETNYKIAQETNASNVEQANLAYQRSLPINQVRNLQDAGYSRIGALQSLSGAGSYTAAPIQSAQMQAPQVDLASMGSALDRLNNVPANTEQMQLIDAQRNALAVDTQTKLNQDKRNQELHEFNIWRQGYDKNTALMLDSASSKIANALIDSGKTMQDFKDFESMIRDLGLDKDKDIRNLTYIARQQLEDGVRSKFDTERARQAQENANRAALDVHNISEEQFRQIQLHNKDFEDEKNARLKEYVAREKAAILQQLLSDSGITREQLEQDIEFDKDENGNLTPKIRQTASENVNAFWNRLLTYIPVRALAQILRIVLGK